MNSLPMTITSLAVPLFTQLCTNTQEEPNNWGHTLTLAAIYIFRLYRSSPEIALLFRQLEAKSIGEIVTVTFRRAKMNYLTRAFLCACLVTLSAPVEAEDHTKPPEIVIQKDGNITNILTTTPSLKKQSALFRDIRQIPRDFDPKIVRWIKVNANYLPPTFLFELSRRLMASDKQAAMEWFTIAMVRARYDAFRCVDRSAGRGIPMLLQMAEQVRRYALSHREEFGRAGLKALARQDLFADEVSPLWICIHGIDAVRAGLDKKALTEEQWFRPEREWPGIKQKVLASFTEYHRQQVMPQDDPIPVSKLGYAVYQPQGEFKFGEYAWLNGKELVVSVENGSKDYRKRYDLSLWRPGSKEKLRVIARGTSMWCAGQDNVMFETGRNSPENGVKELTYQFGAIDNTSENRLRVKGSFNRTKQVQDWNTSSGRVSNPYQMSPFSCRWVKNEVLSKIYSDSWLPLLENDGFLAFDFNYKKLKGVKFSVRYAKNAEDEGEPLPIKWNPIVKWNPFFPKCVRYFDFMKAYFLSPCVIHRTNIADIKKLKCIPHWWLNKKGDGLEVNEQCLSVDSVSENLPIVFPSRAGILRLINERRTFHGPKIGGVYLTTPDGTVSKIFHAWIINALMSPDGCQLALQHYPKGSTETRETRGSFKNREISVVDVCSTLPQSKQ